MLAVIQTMKQSVDMFKATKQWQPNKYMQQLVTDGILYFLVYASLFYFHSFPICPVAHISFNCLHKKLTTLILRYVFYNITIVGENASTSYDIVWNIMYMVSYTVLIPTMPRFIISMRELYDRDCSSRWKGIDSGFGILSQPTASPNGVMSAIAFADVNIHQGESQGGEGGADDPEVIRLEMLGDGAHQLAEGEAENSQAIGAEDRAGHV